MSFECICLSSIPYQLYFSYLPPKQAACKGVSFSIVALSTSAPRSSNLSTILGLPVQVESHELITCSFSDAHGKTKHPFVHLNSPFNAAKNNGVAPLLVCSFTLARLSASRSTVDSSPTGEHRRFFIQKIFPYSALHYIRFHCKLPRAIAEWSAGTDGTFITISTALSLPIDYVFFGFTVVFTDISPPILSFTFESRNIKYGWAACSILVLVPVVIRTSILTAVLISPVRLLIWWITIWTIRIETRQC